ncbi:MAG: type II toxin-antitoxin system Phd/YefM family antitoxin [Verrucomicrobia bacterium]|jgi:antitoxin StbD|nr:type II toxin-antitoxin system Phd/YefM family antitoxin [Verrucomicrobiota bacterium]|tara:strand:- start:39263 stop:39514 length:252 start_codon:yes stop_codon:yes gene_type:complete
MRAILSPFSASISELKKNPSRLIEEANGETVAILNHNKPTAYLVPADTFERMSNLLEDIELGRIVEKRKNLKATAVSVSLDEL